MVRIPNTVSMLGIPYQVEYGGCEPDENGSCSPSLRVIRIREGLCMEQEQQVFLHELIIDLAHTGSGIYDDINATKALASRFIKYHYTVKGGHLDGSKWTFDEVLIVAKDGSIHRIKRGN